MSSLASQKSHLDMKLGRVDTVSQQGDEMKCPNGSRQESPSTLESSVSLVKIPPPPWHRQAAQPPRRGISRIKRLWQPVEDPFFAAFKECTKRTDGAKNADNSNRKGTRVISLVKRSRFVLSCKNGCEIKEDSLVRLPHLPPIPGGTHRFKTSKVSPP